MKMNSKTLLVIAGLLVGSHAIAQDGDTTTVLNRLKKMYPATSFDAISATPLPGLYEVKMGENVAYVEPRGRYFIFGHLFDLPANKDLTVERTSSNQERLKDQRVEKEWLKTGTAFVTQKGNADAKDLVLFSDPLCGYCRKFEQNLASQNYNVRIYPIAFQPGSEEIVKTLLCANDTGAAWNDWTKNRTLPKTKECDTSGVQRNLDLAGKIGVRATPTIISSDGRMIAGALAMTELNRWLAAHEDKLAARLEDNKK